MTEYKICQKVCHRVLRPASLSVSVSWLVSDWSHTIYSLVPGQKGWKVRGGHTGFWCECNYSYCLFLVSHHVRIAYWMGGWVFYLFHSLWLFFRALSLISTLPFETQSIQSLKTIHTIYLWCLTTIGLHVGWLGGFYYLFYSLWLFFTSLSFIPTWPFETQSIQSPTTIHTVYLWCPTMIGLHMGWLGGFYYLFYSLWLFFRALSFIPTWPFRTQSI